MKNTTILKIIDCSKFAVSIYARKVSEYYKFNDLLRNNLIVRDFSRLLEELIKANESTCTICVFDSVLDPSYYDEYFIKQNNSIGIEKIYKFAALMGIPSIKIDGYFSRSVIEAITKSISKINIKVEIYTTDFSLLKLATGEFISLINPLTKKSYTSASIDDEYGVPSDLLFLFNLLTEKHDDLGLGLKYLKPLLAKKLLLTNRSVNGFLKAVPTISGDVGTELKKISPIIRKIEKSIATKVCEIPFKINCTDEFNFANKTDIKLNELTNFYVENVFPKQSNDYFNKCFSEWMVEQKKGSSILKTNRHISEYEHVVYRIKNVISGKIYFGSSNNVKRRWTEHIRDLKNQTHLNPGINNDAKNFGIDSFEFKIISRHSNRQEMLEREQFYIAMFYGRNLYNYRQYVEMENGFSFLPCYFVTAKEKASYKNNKMWEQLWSDVKNVRSYMSQHALSRDLKISKSSVRKGVSDFLVIVENRIYFTNVICNPNKPKNHINESSWRSS